MHDADLAEAVQHDAPLFVESYYVCPEDIDTMNNGAWKPASISGTTGGIWSFEVSTAHVMPEIGFAVDAWDTAQSTIVAEEVPVLEFVSSDGRCILAAEATSTAPGIWHYEYALMNVDMDRKVKSVSIPLPDECEPDCDVDGIPDACDDDSDGDGVPDDIDVCAGSPLGVRVDEMGRPAADLNEDCIIRMEDYR